MKISVYPCFLLFGFASTAIGQTVISDNFNNTTGTTTNLNDDLADRQSGSFVTANGTVNWTDGSAGAASRLDYQNRLAQLQTNLETSGNPARTYAYLNQDFSAALSGAQYQASFDLAMELFTSGSDPATEMGLGDTVYRFLLGSATTDMSSGSFSDWDAAISLNPYYDGDNWQVRASYVIDGVNTTFGDIGFSPVADGPEWQTPTESLIFSVDEVTNTLSVSYGSTSILSSEDLGTALGAGRYFGFASVIGRDAPTASVLQHEVDNFSLSLVPEPSSYALLGGFFAMVVTCLRRRR